jgi:hypothetical protein
VCARPQATEGLAGGAGKSLVWMESVQTQSVWTHSSDACASQRDSVYVVKDASGDDRAAAEAACADWAEGGALAQFTPQEFTCQQSAVAEAVMQQVLILNSEVVSLFRQSVARC